MVSMHKFKDDNLHSNELFGGRLVLPIEDDAEPSVTEQGVNFPTLKKAILKTI